jgi:hypothetical protein
VQAWQPHKRLRRRPEGSPPPSLGIEGEKRPMCIGHHQPLAQGDCPGNAKRPPLVSGRRSPNPEHIQILKRRKRSQQPFSTFFRLFHGRRGNTGISITMPSL